MPRKKTAKFPLFLHSRGQWAKKIRGKTIYFGTDKSAALAKYLKEKDQLQAGINPRSGTPSLPNAIALRDVVNRFLTEKLGLVNSGDLSAYTYGDCHRIAQELIEFFGKDRPVSDLGPEEFSRFRLHLAKTNKSPVSLANAVIRTRSLFNWAFGNKAIAVPIDFGTSFEIPGSKKKRKARNQAKREGNVKIFEAADLRTIIEAARPPLKAMILLGVNCGFGQSDCSTLPLSALDLAGGWVNFPRVKTETDLRCRLWPETVQAITEALDMRTEPNHPEDSGLVFLTTKGNRWIQQHMISEGEKRGTFYRNDNVGKEFDKLLIDLGLKKRGSFYNLRHCFRTWASAAKDREAIDLIMGHADPSMGAHYLEGIDDVRLKAVADVVRSRLWYPPPVPPADVQKVETVERPAFLPFRAAVG